MKGSVTKYIYSLLFVLQLFLVLLSFLLLLDILKTGILFTDNNTLYNTIRVILFLLFQIFLYKFLKKKKVKKESNYIILILISVSILLDGVGNIFGWYEVGNIFWSIQYDDILHFINPFLLTISLHILFIFFLHRKTLSYILSMTTLSFLICIWEIYEYWSDYILQTTMVVDLHDTMLDMTLGIVGGMFAIFFIYLFSRKSTHQQIDI